MSTHMIVETVGYIGSAFVLVSFLMTSVVKLRVLNMIGGVIFGTYAMIIHSYPTAIMQLCLILINVYYLMRLKKDSRHFELIDGVADEAFFKYMQKHYKEDIHTYFPRTDAEGKDADMAYIICCDATPAGLFLGRKAESDSIEIICDYSTPTYRDCSVGTYLYERLKTQGIKKLIFRGDAEGIHEAYLKKMGFIKKESGYVKTM